MKRILAGCLFLIIVAVIGLLAFQIYGGAAAQRAVGERVESIPEFEVSTLNGVSFTQNDLAEDRPVVLIFFRTTCPFCESEINDIVKHPHLLQAASFYLFSSEDLRILRRFVEEFKLGSESGIRVLRDNDGALTQFFDVSSVPNTYIYTGSGELLEHLEGAVRAKAIYKVISGRTNDADGKLRLPDSLSLAGDCGGELKPEGSCS